MPVYLNELEIGTATDLIGFPHVLLCMGVVAMTGNALYGLHVDVTTPATRDGAYRALHGFMQARGAGPIVALYGSCNHTKRYPDAVNRVAAWQAEMTVLAGILGNWHGPARGFSTAFIEPRDGTYIEYRPDFANGACQIHYKRHEKMQAPDRVQHSPTSGFNPDITKYHPGRDALVPVYLEVVSADVKPTWSNKGQLHELDYANRLLEFAV